MRRVLRNADDRHPRILGPRQSERDPLADRIFPRPKTRGHLFIYDRHRRRSGNDVLRGEIAASREWNPERLQIVWTDNLPRRGRQVCGIEFPAFDRKWIVARSAAQRLLRAEAHALHTRLRFDALARMPRIRRAQLAPSSSEPSKWVGCAQLIM